LARLQPLEEKTRVEFNIDPYLRDIVERNLEIAAQCCIDICHRIINLENFRKPSNYYEAFLILGENDVLDEEFARKLAPLAGFRNVLVHEYVGIDWDQVFQNLHRLDELRIFSQQIKAWLKKPI
jgi:uncharacterized protein YutE (UPF0331/DUF86 family)